MLASRRPRLRTDNRALEVVLVSTSILLWLPYIAAAVYVAYCNAFFLEEATTFAAHGAAAGTGVYTNATATATAANWNASLLAAVARSPPATAAASLLHRTRLAHRYSQVYYYVFPDGFDVIAFLPAAAYVLAVGVLAVASTYVCAVHVENGGEFLMVVAWVLGVVSERWWLTSSQHQERYAQAGMSTTTTTMSAATAAASVGGSAGVLYDSSALDALPRPPSWLWLVVSMITGLFSGVLCKVKDITEGKQDRDRHLFRFLDRSQTRMAAVTLVPERALASRPDLSRSSHGNSSSSHRSLHHHHHHSNHHSTSHHEDGKGGGGSGGLYTEHAASHGSRSAHRLVQRVRPSRIIGLGERLYMVVPFCTGQWFHFITQHGWRGIVLENGIIVLTLGMIGYTMVSYQLLKRQVLSVAGRSASGAVVSHYASSSSSSSLSSSSLHRRHGGGGGSHHRRPRLQPTRTATPPPPRSPAPSSPPPSTTTPPPPPADTHNEASDGARTDGAATTATAGGDSTPTRLVEMIDTHKGSDSDDSNSDKNDDDVVSSGSSSSSEEATDVVVASVLEREDVVIDLIDLISKLFTTSFGVVVLVVIGLDVFLTSLAIPFIKALFTLNALVSSAGIIVELIVYDMV